MRHAEKEAKTTVLLFSVSGIPRHTSSIKTVISMAAAEFEELVSEALDTIPVELTSMIENCVIVVEDYPPPDQPGLLGLYEGIPLTERGDFYSAVLPDKISIYRHPTLAICDTMEDVIEEVHITVVHEIAHHFGIDDARLHALGYA